MIFTKNIIVTDEYGTPLEGVNILIAPGIGTTTDQNGRASVTSLRREQTILLSHVGHTSEQYVFQDMPDHVTLVSEVQSLDEVVIIAQKPITTIVTQPKKTGTPWYVWAGLIMSAVGLYATVNTSQSPEPVGLSKPKKPLSRKRKKPVKKSAKKKVRKPVRKAVKKKPIPVTI